MTPDKGLFIAGRWQGGEGTVERRNPSNTYDVVGAFAQARFSQLDEAIAAATLASKWWAAGIQKRHDVLMAIGLAAAIMTRRLARPNHFRANLRAGGVMVNLPAAGTDYHVPFGGREASSFSPREQGSFAAEFYTTVKTAYTAEGTPE